MNAVSSLHPADKTLSSYSLGKLDDKMAEAVNKHLERCQDCRKRVAEMSADSFLERVRKAQEPSGKSTFGKSQPEGTHTSKTSNIQSPPAENTLPPALADHPDYEIKRELGRGGMGVVYLAHNKLMGRDEVLKVIGRQIMERPGVLERFLREIRAVSKLRHPNIVAAYSAVRLGESIVFGMEYVEGLDLAKMVKAKGPLPVAHACSFVHQAALGVQHAHEEGLVRRDIKPGNLMLSHKGDKALVKVLDFGLAKVTREEKVDGGLTSEGQALGTPDFIAPEQIVDAPSADIRADIYSLGATLYYLLTGHPPFKANSLYDMFQAHISRDADPLNLVRPEVPAELASLVAKMMAKDPARRFQTPGEVAEALTPFFKKGNAAFKRPKADVSQAGQSSAGQPVPAAAFRQTERATDAGKVAVQAKRAVEPTATESRWESLIEFRETGPSVDEATEAGPARRPPWKKWPIALAGSLFGLVALGVIIITIRDKSGRETKITVPDDSRVVVEAPPENVEIKPPVGSREEARGTGAPAPAPGEAGSPPAVKPQGPPSDNADPQKTTQPIARAAEEVIRPFNGKDFRGWNGSRGYGEVVDPSSIFRIEGEELVWTGNSSGRICLDEPLGDFSLKFEYLLPLNGRYHLASCLLMLAEGEPYQIGQANYRVCWAGCVLTNSEVGRTGDILSWEHTSHGLGGYVAQRKSDAARPAGEWNEVEIRCEGRSIRFFLNGREVNRVEGNRAITCNPGLHSWGTDIRYRNIRLARLTKNTKATEKNEAPAPF